MGVQMQLHRVGNDVSICADKASAFKYLEELRAQDFEFKIKPTIKLVLLAGTREN
jgi:hypothetical protein